MYFFSHLQTHILNVSGNYKPVIKYSGQVYKLIPICTKLLDV